MANNRKKTSVVLDQEELQESKADSQKIYANQKFIAGVKTDVKQGILEYNDRTFIYVSGNNVIVHELGLKDGKFFNKINGQHFIQGIEGAEGITALALSPCKKFLAVCEKSKQAVCSIFDPSPESFMVSQKRKKCLTSSDYRASEFVAATFSDTRKGEVLTNYLVTLTGEPDFAVLVWLFEKGRLLAMQKMVQNLIPTHVSFKPDDNSTVIVTGKDLYRKFQIVDNMRLHENKSWFVSAKDLSVTKLYTCHIWIDNRLIVCTSKGEILIGDQNGEFKFVLPESPGGSFPIRKIVSKERNNFVIADDSGRFKVYENSQDPKCPFIKSQFEIQLGHDFKSISKVDTLPVKHQLDSDNDQWAKHVYELSGAPYFPLTNLELAGDYLIFTTENRQIMKMTFNLEKQKEIGLVSFLTQPFHSQPITDLACCLKRNILVTGSLDRTIRVWDFNHLNKGMISNDSQYNFSELKICQNMNREVYALDLHTSGNYIIASFVDQVEFYSVNNKELKIFHKIGISCCKVVKFSNQGNLVALQHQNDVDVYRFFTAHMPENYRFEFHKSFPTVIQWTEDDSGFVTTSLDHEIAVWQLPNVQNTQSGVYDGIRVQKPQPIWTYSNGMTLFQSLVSIKQVVENKNKENNKKDQKLHVVFAAASDGSIYEINHQETFMSPFGKLVQKYEMGVNLSQISIFTGRKCLVAGLDYNRRPGSLLMIPYPFSNERPAELTVHSSGIAKLRLNYDHSLAFTVGYDGCVSILQIKDEERRKEHFPTPHITQQTIIPESQRTKILSEISFLEQEIHSIKHSNKTALAHTIEQKQKEKKAEEDKLKECDNQKQQREKELERLKEDAEKQQDLQKKEIQQKHNEIIDKMFRDNSNKTIQDESKYQELMQQRNNQLTRNQKELIQIAENHKKALKNKLSQNEMEKQRLADEIKELIKIEQEIGRKAIVEREQLEENTWNQIDDKVITNKDQLAIKIEQGLTAKGELTRKQKELRELKTNKEALMLDSRNQEQTQIQNEQQKKQLQQDIVKARQGLEQRDETLENKKTDIMNSKKTIQELEKFKFVLNYKINELRSLVGPKSVIIMDLNVKANQMKQELKHFNRVNSNLSLIVQDMRMRQEGLKKELCEMRKELASQDQEKRIAVDAVAQIFLNSISDFKKLKKALVRLYRRWVLDERNSQLRSDNTDVFEAQRQKRKQLENSITVLRGRLNSVSKNFKKENKRIIKENVILIQTINDLKQEHKKLKDKLSKIDDAVDPLQLKYGNRAKSARPPKGLKQLYEEEELEEIKSQSSGEQLQNQENE